MNFLLQLAIFGGMQLFEIVAIIYFSRGNTVNDKNLVGCI